MDHETDGQAAADALVANHARLVEAEAAELALAAHWADLHDEHTLSAGAGAGAGSGSGRVLPGTERARRFGGAGTPLVAEFAAAELGCLLGRSPGAAATLVADAVDVRHRLPRWWSAVAAGTARVWQARHVAARTRSVGLSLEQARWVDAQTVPYVGSLPWSRLLDLLEAKIVEVDPEAAQARADAAALERFVATGQCNEYGLKTVVAKAAAGDAVFFVAMCDRVAQILLLQGDTDPVGARRSKALGILANPARALALLARFQTTPDGTGPLVEPVETTPDADTDADGTGPLVEPVETTPDADTDTTQDTRSPRSPRGTCTRPTTTPTTIRRRLPDCGQAPAPAGDPAVFVRALATIDPRRLLPAATLYVHVSRESFDAARSGKAQGVARVEGVGPVTIDQAREFLAHTQVSVKPVIDLAADHPVDGYEVPDRTRELVHLRTPAEVFPWSGNLSRAKDLDHTVPYLAPDRGGPPGQTRVGNLGPLSRHGHRVKTHGRGWRHHQPVPGVFLWRTPHGYWYRTDHAGTHPLGTNPTDADLAGSPALPSPAEAHLAALIGARSGR